MKKFAIHTLGCKTNQLESSAITQILLDNNYQQVDFDEQADFYIINTCTVTLHADSDSLYYIRRAKKTNPDAKIIVTGCYAQLNSEEIDADIIIGNARKLDILEFINKNSQGISDIMQEKEFHDKRIPVTKGRTRANIKIQDGCNNRCSYCIIPYARGYSRSNSIENILGQIKLYIQNDYKEIVITGIHIGQWGKDLVGKPDLLELLKKIEELPDLPRYRLGSLDPNEITIELIDFLSKSNKFAHHLHISLQNANDEILHLMNRRYTSNDILEKMNLLKAKMPDISLGCDIIAGFPTETDEQFEICTQNIIKMPFSYMHVFPYSIRPGTPASKMKQVDEKIKKLRAKKLRDIASEKKQKFLSSFIGKKLEVLIEKKPTNNGLLKGISSNYIPIILSGDNNLQNQLIEVIPIKVENKNLLAEILSE